MSIASEGSNRVVVEPLTVSVGHQGFLHPVEGMLRSLPPRSRGTDLLVETTMGKLIVELQSDLTLRSEVRNPDKLMDRALLWLHEQEITQLNKGLAVFRPAMTIRLKPERRGFVEADFRPLRMHYDEQTLQIHVMAEYAQQGLGSMTDAVRLPMNYFNLPEKEFLGRWLPDRAREISRQTTAESWRTIVEDLKNPSQRRIGGGCGTAECAGAGGSGLRQDAGPRSSHRLPDTGQKGEPPVHPGTGLQPARRTGDTSPSGSTHRRRCSRGDRPYLSRPSHAPGGGQFLRTCRPSRRRSIPGSATAGDLAAAARRAAYRRSR